MLIARGGLLGRGRTSSPLSAAAVLLQALPREESCRVQAEHDTRPAFLALDFLARLRSTVPYMRRHMFWCQPPRRRQTAQERGTELLLSVCALCFGPALDCASGFVVDSTRLCHCFGHALRAWNQIRLEHGGGQLSQFCRVDQRQSGQHVHQAPSFHPSATACLTARRPCSCGASSGLRLPQEGISKSVISENVAQMFSEMLLEL